MTNNKFVAFLRGINVGGHHKVPMADLKALLIKMKCEQVITILNSGNIIFTSRKDDAQVLEGEIAARLQKTFGFPIPTLIRHADVVSDLLQDNPFSEIEVTKDIRRYVSFLKEENDQEPLELPWSSDDASFRILGRSAGAIYSVLDLQFSGTPKAMGILEKAYGKNITTRNWKTIERVGKKL